jgi:hypothetical protein
MTSKLTGSFRTHQHYLEAFAFIATGGQWKLSDSYHSVRVRFVDSVSCPQIGVNIENSAHVQRSMENAWGTELILLLSHRLLKGDEIVRVSNNWNVVQAYYALYHATQALIVARGLQRPESHPKTQKMFLDFWGRLPVEFAPWSLSVGGDGHHPDTFKFDTHLHAWTTVDSNTCWSIACKALQTTRTDYICERIKLARENKRKANHKAWLEKKAERAARHLKKDIEPRFRLPLLTIEEKKQVDYQTRNYSLIDYLFRLRIRSNYIDSAMFTEGPEHESESSSVRVSLLKIVCTSLLASELILCTSPHGKQSLVEWASRWIEKNVPKGMSFGVSERIRFWNSDA